MIIGRDLTPKTDTVVQQPSQQSQSILRSMSLMEMLQLGKEIKEKPTTGLQLLFNLDQLCWSNRPVLLNLSLRTERSRDTFIASNQDKRFNQQHV